MSQQKKTILNVTSLKPDGPRKSQSQPDEESIPENCPEDSQPTTSETCPQTIPPSTTSQFPMNPIGTLLREMMAENSVNVKIS